MSAYIQVNLHILCRNGAIMEFITEKEKSLQEYLPELTKEPDFDTFWTDTLTEAREHPLNFHCRPVSYPAKYLKLYDIDYEGMDGTMIHGWYMEPNFTQEAADNSVPETFHSSNTPSDAPLDMPSDKSGKFPCLVNFHGFSGDRGQPHDFFLWVMAGMAVLTVDCREQGGSTGSSYAYSSTGIINNVTTKGLMDPKEYYYRYAYTDCLRALDVACQIPSVDKDRLVVHGISQGGGIGTAVCALDHRPCAALLDVPSCADLPKRVWGEYGAFSAVADYLRKYPFRIEQAMKTLSYFDTMNHAEHITCPVYASVALKDNICPAECFFAAYNRITAPKQITIYPFNGHDGARHIHWQKKLEYLQNMGIIDR